METIEGYTPGPIDEFLKLSYRSGASKMGLMELLAFTGGLWFFIAYIIVDPIRRRFVKQSEELEEVGVKILKSKFKISRENADSKQLKMRI